ncbi:MAG: TlpA family protein disulfide reductase [Ignavibacteriaceae bacterium]|nr:TlpA family protein disulfide reductase [Ignavibacteriaceae bacterium]
MFVLYVTVSLFGYDKKEAENNIIPKKEITTSVLKEGKKAADFTLKTLDGKNVKLSDYKGKVVIIDFWATWCPPCRKGVPDLVDIQKEYKDNLVIIGISLDQQNTLKDLAPFIKNYGINYPVVLGTQQVVTDYGNIRSIPTSFVIDQSGNIVDTHVGLVQKSTYTNKINQLLKKS